MVMSNVIDFLCLDFSVYVLINLVKSESSSIWFKSHVVSGCLNNC